MVQGKLQRSLEQRQGAQNVHMSRHVVGLEVRAGGGGGQGRVLCSIVFDGRSFGKLHSFHNTSRNWNRGFAFKLAVMSSSVERAVC